MKFDNTDRKIIIITVMAIISLFCYKTAWVRVWHADEIHIAQR